MRRDATLLPVIVAVTLGLSVCVEPDRYAAAYTATAISFASA